MAANLENSEKKSISTFKKTSNDFFNLWNSLTDSKKMKFARDKLPVNMKNEYFDLLDRGKFIESKIKWIDGLINQAAAAYTNVKAWLSSAFGLDGYQNYNYQQLQGLGVIPLIPVAIIAGAVSFIGYWINDAYQFNAKLNEIIRLENKGMSPTKASELVRKTFNKKGFFSSFSGLLMPVALGAGVLLYLKMKK